MEKLTPKLTSDEKDAMARTYAEIHRIVPDREALKDIIFNISALEKVADIEKTKFGRGLVQVFDGMFNLGIDASNIFVKMVNLIPIPDPASFERGYAHELDKLELTDHAPIKNAAQTLAWLKEQAQQLLAEETNQEGGVAVKE